MIERLGNLIYWLGCGAAVLWLVLLGTKIYTDGLSHRPTDDVFVLLVPPAVFWLVGRGAKYLFAGK
jgi:hypothetical protein